MINWLRKLSKMDKFCLFASLVLFGVALSLTGHPVIGTVVAFLDDAVIGVFGILFLVKKIRNRKPLIV